MSGEMEPQALYRQERAKRQQRAPVATTSAPRQRAPYKRLTTLPFRCGDARAPENTYTNKRTGVTSCLTCRRRRSSRRSA